MLKALFSGSGPGHPIALPVRRGSHTCLGRGVLEDYRTNDRCYEAILHDDLGHRIKITQVTAKGGG